MKQRNNITFQPEPDIYELLAQADKRGRGVRSKVINQALRELLVELLRRHDVFRSPQNGAEGSH